MGENDLKEFYAARADSDVGRMLSFAHPDCVFRIVGSKALAPFTQTTKGEALRAFATELVADWDFRGVTDVSVHRIGDTVYVHRAGEVVYRPDKRTLQTEFMDKLTFLDGKIVEYLQFVDTYAVAKLLDL